MYNFVRFCETKRILVLCLPSHTTHRLQPCDVGVFGPLASSWKSEVNVMGRQYKKITKYNLLGIYHSARQRALTITTIRASFQKTGIWPFNPTVIPDMAFEPALNTTTQAAQPVPTALSSLLEVVPFTTPPPTTTMTASIIRTDTALPDPSGTTSVSAMGSTSTMQEPTSYSTFRLVSFPAHLPRYASQEALLYQNKELRAYCMRAKKQMEADHASKQLMDAENQRLRNWLFEKSKKPTRRKEGGSSARHMTSQECMIALAKDIWKSSMVDVHKQIVERRKAQESRRQALAKVLEPLAKKIGGKQRAALKDIEAERQRIEKEIEAERWREDKERKAMEQAQKKAEAEANKQRAKDQKAADKEQKVVEKARQKAEKEADKQRKQAEKAKQTTRKRKLDELTVDENTDPAVAQAPKRPRPSRPRPYPRPNILVPTITGGPADLPNDIAAQYATVPNHTMASVMLNGDNAPSKTTGNEMVLDPVLVNQL